MPIIFTFSEIFSLLFGSGVGCWSVGCRGGCWVVGSFLFFVLSATKTINIERKIQNKELNN